MFAWLFRLFRKDIHIYLHMDGRLDICRSQNPGVSDGFKATVRKISKPTFKPITEDDVEIEVEMPPVKLNDIQIPKAEFGEEVHD